MRSTVDLENALDKRLRKAAAHKKISFKSALNQAVAAGLRVILAKKPDTKKYKVQAKACGWMPGIDTERLASLYDQLESEERFRSK